MHMKVIMKYLKPFAGTILVSLLILFGQAIGELSLPNLMSDIVNTGIQNGGVEQEAPEALPSEGFALMTLFMAEEDKETFQNSYQLIEGGSAEAEAYSAEFPESQETDFYVLDETDGTIVLAGEHLQQGKLQLCGVHAGNVCTARQCRISRCRERL